MEDAEFHRYIEYFQRQLAPEGVERFWKGQEKWFETNRAQISEKFRSLSRNENDFSDVLANDVLAHEKNGQYDDFFANRIFEPLVNKALNICKEGGFAPQYSVKVANSPAIDISPTALPSTHEHLLFAGQGTFAFCNYWSKIYSTAISEIAELPDKELSSPESMITKLQEGRVLVNAAQLAMHYACFGSVLGFGKLVQSSQLVTGRALMVNAMEIFVIGHEIGHFIGHEGYPESCGVAPGKTAGDHELECDKFGLAISTQYGVQENNAFAFQLIGALLFFYALRTCEQVKYILLGTTPESSDTHPSHEERFRQALDFLQDAGAKEHIMESVHFALDVGFCIGAEVQLIAQKMKPHFSEG